MAIHHFLLYSFLLCIVIECSTRTSWKDLKWKILEMWKENKNKIKYSSTCCAVYWRDSIAVSFMPPFYSTFALQVGALGSILEYSWRPTSYTYIRLVLQPYFPIGKSNPSLLLPPFFLDLGRYQKGDSGRRRRQKKNSSLLSLLLLIRWDV